MWRSPLFVVVLLALGAVCFEESQPELDTEEVITIDLGLGLGYGRGLDTEEVITIDLDLEDPMIKEEIISVAGLRKETLQFQEVIELQLPRVVELARALKELQHFELYYTTMQGTGHATNVAQYSEEYTRVYKKLLVALLEEAGNLVEDDSEGVEE